AGTTTSATPAGTATGAAPAPATAPGAGVMPVPGRHLTRAERKRLADAEAEARAAEAAALAERQRLADAVLAARKEAEDRHKAAEAADRAQKKELTDLADDAILVICLKDQLGAACDLAVQHATRAGAVPDLPAAVDKSCAAGDEVGCIAKVRIGLEGLGPKDGDKIKPLMDQLLTICETADHGLCPGLVEAMLKGRPSLQIAADPARARRVSEARCQRGDLVACDVAVRAFHDATAYGLAPDAAKLREVWTRACQIGGKVRCATLCAEDPGAPICEQFQTFDLRKQCDPQHPDLCEKVGKRFRDGTGVGADAAAASHFYRLACDASRKSACVALDDLCVAAHNGGPKVDDGQCVQALIHTDLFYEAEWQFRETGNAQLMDKPDDSAPAAAAVAVATTSSQASAGISLSRGHLDADLVVSVVLDRARQAAIKLVVDELERARGGARTQYMRDLLAQGARLLADPSTLRREKFADLAMTVVRAFVAANLVDTLYPDTDAVLKAPEIGADLRAAGTALGQREGGPMSPLLRTYLVDLAYQQLGETNLFAREHDVGDVAIPCPWPNGPGVDLCKRLADGPTAQAALHIDGIIEGVRLAKALRAAGTIDLRRLIEAVERSRSIADLASTPGLVLDEWRTHLVDRSTTLVARVHGAIADLQLLLDPDTYGEELDLPSLSAKVAGIRDFLHDPTSRMVIEGDNRAHLEALLAILDTGTGAALAADSRAKEVRSRARDALKEWGDDAGALAAALAALDRSAQRLAPTIKRLDHAVHGIETVMKRLRSSDDDGAAGTPGSKLELDDLPLYSVGELRDAYREAVSALSALDAQLRQAFPDLDNGELEFARSASIRLLGLLDLLERVARTSRLQEKASDVIGALRLLGSYQGSEFTAPLYDVLEPVLDAMKTHEPMSVDLLFAVISKVRLDSLIESLQGGGNACANDRSVDCWTVKIIHALQESVERDGDMIRVDGGKFAERLAAHGDDFRRRHRWRGFFHLTVGVGAMTSTPRDDETRRSVPVIAEQVGFGWASPSVWGDRLTFKVGAAASGILYRALLDSKESNAIMVHPVFLAVDVEDLVELYVSPATVLVYPPDDSHGTDVKLGMSAGLSVPLSAYLERL
ncbi:MAG TPA: hypothetical protein VHE35_16660, partial [Kofleriaceae bacterium]|nr:hypothetical protein [Kofleriaceae bacterium]